MNAPLIWFLLGLGFFFTELMTPTLMLLFFGVGAWAAACAALLGWSVDWQVSVFITLSLLTLVVLRQRLRAVFGGRAQKADDGDEQPQPHQLTGRLGVASKVLAPGQVGEVSIDGSFWRAVTEHHIPRGGTIRVLGALPTDALLLRVAPVEDDKA